MKLLLVSLIFIATSFFVFSLEEESIDEIYSKIELESGTLDSEGNSLDFLFKKTSLKQGRYEIELTDGPGDLYEVKNSKIFLKFRGYHGYAGYNEKGILIIGSNNYSSKFIKIED